MRGSSIPQLRASRRLAGSERGFSLLELLITVAIIVIMTAMAVPLITASMRDYQLRSAITSVTGAIQATRYRAISSGYPYRLVLTKAAATYQIQSEVPPAAAFTNVGGAVPLSGSSVAAVIDGDATLEFHPSGKVLCPVGTTNAATGNTTILLTLQGKTETITISRYGYINVTP